MSQDLESQQTPWADCPLAPQKLTFSESLVLSPSPVSGPGGWMHCGSEELGGQVHVGDNLPARSLLSVLRLWV